MDVGDDVRSGLDQELVAALEGVAPEVVLAQMAELEVGADGAVEDDDPLGNGIEIRTMHHDMLPGGLEGPKTCMVGQAAPVGHNVAESNGQP